jgi:hypothetical protein
LRNVHDMHDCLLRLVHGGYIGGQRRFHSPFKTPGDHLHPELGVVPARRQVQP